MASGLSVDTQITTILVAILRRGFRALADAFGIGLALATLGAGTAVFYILVRVREPAAVRS